MESLEKKCRNQETDVSELSHKMQNILQNLGLSANVEDVIVGPLMIIYKISLNNGVSINKIKSAKNDISIWLGEEIVSIEPIPNEQVLGIFTQRINQENVDLVDIIDSEDFHKEKSNLTIAIGKEMDGTNKIINLEEHSNILIAGATGSGKSECIHSIINSIIYKAKPNDVKLILIDTKGIELTVYNGLPHLLEQVIIEPNMAIGLLSWLNMEMQNRHKVFATKGVGNYKDYIIQKNNENDNDIIPQIVVVIDDFADLMEVEKNIAEELLYTIMQRGEKLGIYFVIATERISRRYITEKIKSNISTRIAFDVFSQDDSKIIIGEPGAENLNGHGEMLLYSVGNIKPCRVQGCHISEGQVKDLIELLKSK